MIIGTVRILAEESFKRYCLNQKSIETLFDMVFKKDAKLILNDHLLCFHASCQMMGMEQFKQFKNLLIDKLV